MRVVFMGTAELACPILRALHRSFEVAAVVTQPDKPRGRNLELQFPAVKQAALELGLPVLQPNKARDPEFIGALGQLAPSLIIVVAYGQILPPTVLAIPALGCVNVHTSILPKYRGAAPIQWAILNGESKTGVTIMKMDEGLDTGPLLAIRETLIEPTDTSETLHDRLAEMGAELIVPTIRDYAAARIEPQPQPSEGASYARKISKEDGRIDWSKPAMNIWNQVRAFTPWPGAYTFQATDGKPKLLKIWQAEPHPGTAKPGEVLQAGKGGILIACGEGALRITQLQREGGRRVTAQEFVAGANLRAGEMLG